LKINKTELQNALEKVRPGLANRDLIEQATSFSFMGNRVVTYNDEISISHPVKDLAIKGAIKATALYEFLNRIKKDEIDIKEEENQVIIKSGKSKAGLIFENETKLPIEEIGEIGDWEAVPKNFIEALKFCHPICANDMSRPTLTCVHITNNRAEASDSCQIVSYDFSEALSIKSCLIPATSVRALVKYNVTKVSLGESWIHFKTEDGTVFSSRILDHKFPDTSIHFNTEGIDFCFPENIEEILQRAFVFSKSANDTPMVVVSINEKGKIKITSKNEYGWFEESAVVKADYNGGTISFSVGIEFLLGVFSKGQSCVIGAGKISFTGENWRHVVAIMADEEGSE